MLDTCPGGYQVNMGLKRSQKSSIFEHDIPLWDLEHPTPAIFSILQSVTWEAPKGEDQQVWPAAAEGFAESGGQGECEPNEHQGV